MLIELWSYSGYFEGSNLVPGICDGKKGRRCSKGGIGELLSFTSDE